MHPFRFSLFLVAGVLGFAACQPASDTPVASTEFELRLLPQIPSEAASVRWSPKGEKLPLVAAEGYWHTTLALGPAGTAPVGLRLEKSEGATHFDRLRIDYNRDGIFAETEVVTTEPNLSRNKYWSSFDAVVDLPVADPWTGETVQNAYPLAFWYVEDPGEPEAEQVLRFSRRGWMQGTGLVDGQTAHIMLTESVMDGRFDTQDSWAMALPDSAANLLAFGYARPGERHAWLGEQAYRLVSIDPSGRKAVVAPFNPGTTRADERIADDKLAVDRRAPRSGQAVAFGRDFAAAEAMSQTAGKPLFIDFETVWCGPCKTMDEWVYSADAVVERAAEVIAVKVDGDDFPDLAERFNVTAYPTMILLDAEGAEVRRSVGYRSVAEMTAFLTLSE